MLFGVEVGAEGLEYTNINISTFSCMFPALIGDRMLYRHPLAWHACFSVYNRFLVSTEIFCEMKVTRKASTIEMERKNIHISLKTALLKVGACVFKSHSSAAVCTLLCFTISLTGEHFTVSKTRNICLIKGGIFNMFRFENWVVIFWSLFHKTSSKQRKHNNGRGVA